MAGEQEAVLPTRRVRIASLSDRKKLRSQLKLGHILHAFFLDYFTFLPSFLCWLLSCPSPNTAGLSSVLSWDSGLLHRAPSREVGSFPLPSLTSLLNPGLLCLLVGT